MGYRTFHSVAGMNKTHGSTVGAARLDSFQLRDKALRSGRDYFEIHAHVPQIATERLYWTRVYNNYDPQGDKPRIYFICPVCGRRVRYVYYKALWGRLKCRECGKLNYPIQQVAKGTRRHEVQMKAALKRLMFGEADSLPPTELSELSFIPRPRYMHESTYTKYLKNFISARENWKAAYRREAIAILCKSNQYLL